MRNCVLFAWIVGILVLADILVLALVAGFEQVTLVDMAWLQAFAQFRIVWVLLAILACLVALVKDQEAKQTAPSEKEIRKEMGLRDRARSWWEALGESIEQEARQEREKEKKG